MSLVKINKLSAGYGRDIVVDNIDFEIYEGELVGLLGLNGSGKSTLAKAICGILPCKGEVFIAGNPTEKLKPKELAKLISYLPQHSGLGLDISVLDVVLMGFNVNLRLLENPSISMKDKAQKTLEAVGLGDKTNSNYMTLSEGQKQLVILARALVSEGCFMVMDEPESALDFSVRYRLMKLVKGWIAEGSRAGLAILHDTSIALSSCDKLILLKGKGICAVIDMHRDSMETIEEKFRQVYGDITLIKSLNGRGKEILTMIHNTEEV